MKRASRVLAAAIAATCAAGAFGLAGCSSGQHEVIDQGKACSSCHSGDKQTYDVDAPSGAAQSSGAVTVKTSASEVPVCKPIFISSDGSKFVPEQVSSQAASGGQADLQLSEGTWAVCTDEGGTVKAKLVTVSAGASGACDVEL